MVITPTKYHRSYALMGVCVLSATSDHHRGLRGLTQGPQAGRWQAEQGLPGLCSLLKLLPTARPLQSDVSEKTSVLGTDGTRSSSLPCPSVTRTDCFWGSTTLVEWAKQWGSFQGVGLEPGWVPAPWECLCTLHSVLPALSILVPSPGTNSSLSLSLSLSLSPLPPAT